MLDYAANAAVSWSIERIQGWLEETCAARGASADETVRAFLEEKWSAEDLWLQARTNLQAGRLRLLFVADRIPQELRRIIEFLNCLMEPAEVLGVEVRQYTSGDGTRSLVPRLIGQTEEAHEKKSALRGSRQWDEGSFFEDLEAHVSQKAVQAARAILDWSKRRMTTVFWGNGTKDGSFLPRLMHKGAKHDLIAVVTYGRVSIQFQYMTSPPFSEPGMRREALRRLNAISGVTVPDAPRPAIPLEVLADSNRLASFIEVLDWMVDQIVRS